MKKYAQETICIQGGYEPKNGEPRILPIFQSTTYKYDEADEVAKLFDLEAAGHMYSRISNPTVEALEKKIAEMECLYSKFSRKKKRNTRTTGIKYCAALVNNRIECPG